VWKQAGPWTPAVNALLEHFERVGFTGAPRALTGLPPSPSLPTGSAGAGSRSGHSAFSFVPGESPHPRAWPDEAVGGVGRLLRAVHDAGSSFDPPPGAVWQSSWLRDLPGTDLVISHCDTGPWNIVGTGGRAESFVDWEFAGPVDRLWELAATVWLNAQLHDDDIAAHHDLPDAPARAHQARLIADGYGLASAQRAELADRLPEVAIHAARAEAVAGGVTLESTQAVTADGYPTMWGIAWRARSASWMARHRDLLRRALR
jgi:phosphotransferase family enzyme